MNSSVTFCDICGYTIKGCFYNCKNCGNREVKYYDGFFNEDLMSAYRRLSGARPGGSTLTSLALVAAIVTVSITIYAAHTQHPSVKLAGSVVSGAAEQVDSFASVHCPELSHQLAGGSSKLPQGMLGIIGKTF